MKGIENPQCIKDLRSIFEMLSLKNKKALVVGAAGGIGRSIAAAFAELGAEVALVDLPSKNKLLEEICQQITDRYGARTIPITGDVTTADTVASFMEKVEKELGTVHVVSNNAGAGIPGDDSDITYQAYNKQIAIFQTGVLLAAQASANIMKKNGHGGSIINTASMSGHIINRGRPGIDRHSPGYTSVKAAVIHMTKGLAAEYVNYGIRVNSISPGYISSGIHSAWDKGQLEWFVSTVPMGRFGQLDELMGIAAYLASDLSSYVTGADFLIDGGYTIW